jgi:hypothetical protein
MGAERRDSRVKAVNHIETVPGGTSDAVPVLSIALALAALRAR